MDILLITLFICFLLWLLNKYFSWSFQYNVRESPQTIHTKSVSRMGGLAVFAPLFLVSFFIGGNTDDFEMLRKALILSLPVFLVGLIDDIKIHLKPTYRIIAMLPTPLLLFFFLDLQIRDVGLDFFNNLLNYNFVALIFLCFAVVGMVNAFNIIDGFNGLLASYNLLIVVNIYLNLNSSVDIKLVFFITALFFTSLGVFLVNFPFGKIFLGDGGAYLLGVLIPIALIKFQQQLDLSPWYVLVMLIYPTVEVLASIIRRAFFKKASPFNPDALHLHQLVYKRATKILGFKKVRLLHFSVTAFVILLNLPFFALANRFKNDDITLMLISVLFCVVYVLIYLSLLPKRLFLNKIT